jgi:hypothetical protein
MAKKINITAQLNAATTDGILADAGQIFDAKKGKFQEQVNEEFEDALEEAITSEETDMVVESIEEGIVHNALRKTEQILTEAEKYQARENIGAVSEQTFENEAVRVKKQVFTSEQKYQARHNISAITAEEAEKIAQDKINEAAVSSPDKLQAVKELSSWLEENPDNAATMNAAIQDNYSDIQRLYRGTGIEEYSQFSDGNAYAAGDVVLYDGVLFRFKADHAKGAWDYNEVEEWSEHKEREEKLTELESELGSMGMAVITALGIEERYTKLIDGYIDGTQSVLPTPTSSTSVMHIIIEVKEGELYTVQSVRRNDGYLYILYDTDNNRVGYFSGTNNTVITIGVTIPSGVVKMVVNCDSAYIDKFSVFKQNKGTIVSTQFDKSEVLLPSQKMVSESLQASYPWIKSYNNLPSPSSLSIVKDIWFEGIDGKGIPSELGSTIIPILRTINQEGTGYSPIFLGLVKEGEIAYYKGCLEMYRDDSYYIGRIAIDYENIRCNAFALLDITALQGSETILASNNALTNMVEVLVKDKSLLSLPNVDIKGISSKLTELNDKALLLENEIFEKEIYYTKESLSEGYCDTTRDTLQQPNTGVPYIKYILISDLREGDRYIITSARYNNGYVYGLYDKNGDRIRYYAGANHVVETVELVIPSDAATLAINCDAAFEDSFSVISSNDSLSSRVERLEEFGSDVEELSAKNRVVWTLGSSTIDLMKTTTNADGVKDWTYLGQLLGAKKLYNIAIGGSTWQWQGLDTDAPDINNTVTRSASNQIKMMKRLVDSGNYEYPEIIFLQFTNGYSFSGTITDNMEQVMAMSFEELEANTDIRKMFYGGVRYALELLNRYFPKATYYVSDGIQCDRDLPYRRGYEYVKSGRDALKRMCDRYSCPFLETSRSIGIVDLYEHGSKTSTSNIEILTGATATGTIVLSLKDNDIEVSVTTGDTANVVAQKIANAVNSFNTGWSAELNDSKVLLSVAKESAAVPEFNAASTGVSVDITFNQFADDYDGIYLSTDGLHPNEKGKKLIARCVAKSINETYFQKQ